MSGIVGIVGTGSTAELRQMAARMSHRGVHVQTWNPAPRVYLGTLGKIPAPRTGQGALALDASGHLYPGQPQLDTRERIATHLSQRLVADSTSALLELRGSFSLAYWDERDGSVLLATDRQGYKPLYFIEMPGRIAFASEYKALLALGDCPAEIDRSVLQTYFVTLNCPSDRALLKGVHRLCSARTARLRPGRHERQRYWVRQRGDLGLSFDDAARELRRLLEGSLRNMTAGYPRAGITLSGGLDSTALLALMRHVRPDMAIGSHTIGYGAEDPEIIGAQETADHFGTDHHPVHFDIGQIEPLLPSFVWSTEDLMGREETLLQQSITRELAAHERLFVAGNGADLDFCGMPRHRLLWLRDRTPPPLRSAVDELFVYTQIRRTPQSLGGRFLRRMVYGTDTPDPPQVPGANAPRFKGDHSSLANYQCDTMAEWSFNYHERLNTELGLVMACPFSDPDVMEFALRCPIEYMIDRRQRKRILRAAVADLMPPALVGRRKAIQRLDHTVPMSDAIEQLARRLDIDRSLEARGLVAPGYVRQLRNRPAGRAYTEGQVHNLWPLLCTEIWMRMFVDQRASRAPDTDIPHESQGLPYPFPQRSGHAYYV